MWNKQSNLNVLTSKVYEDKRMDNQSNLNNHLSLLIKCVALLLFNYLKYRGWIYKVTVDLY